MRVHCFVIAVCSYMLAAIPALAHRDRIEGPSSIVVRFEDSEATFRLADQLVTGLRVRTAGHSYVVPAAVCKKLRHVVFPTVSLLWDDLPAAEKYYEAVLRFSMGGDRDIRFGELPQVHLYFASGRFLKAEVTYKDTNTSWQTKDL